uniref:hypothetical protein n=1 Tax=Vibrio kanaloae TaxID=170673 RepID=UPI0019D19FEA
FEFFVKLNILSNLFFIEVTTKLSIFINISAHDNQYHLIPFALAVFLTRTRELNLEIIKCDCCHVFGNDLRRYQLKENEVLVNVESFKS